MTHSDKSDVTPGRARVPTATFGSFDALVSHWGDVEELSPHMLRVRNGAWNAWVMRAEPFDCAVALELYGVDPDAEWPAKLLMDLFLYASQPVKMQRMKALRQDPGAAIPSLFAHLSKPELEPRFEIRSGPRELFSEDDWGRALVDHRGDAFGGTFEEEGLRKSVVALIPLTLSEWIMRGEGGTVAETRKIHEALDRDVLASPRWRQAWHDEAGGNLATWLAQQPMIRRRVVLAGPQP